MFTGAVAVTLLAGCDDPPAPEFAVPVASATVEVREAVSDAELQAQTKVVMLGTGTPIPDAYRAGPSVAIVHKGEAYLFDAGSGSVQNATTARYRYDIPSLYPTEICCVFLTHLHSDHTLDFVELNFTMWWRRRGRLLAFGPAGLQEMADGMLAMMGPDRRGRESSRQPIVGEEVYRPIVAEISEGVVFRKDDLTVAAFTVPHGDMRPAFGYKITTDDLTVVISGDTGFSEKIQEMATGADILIHEVISSEGLSRTSQRFQASHRISHTTATDVGKLAAQAKPGLLVLYHGLYYGTEESGVLDEVSMVYDGDTVLADDLDIFPAGGQVNE